METRILLLIAAFLCQPLAADNLPEKDKEMRRTCAKEAARAMESSANFADQTSFEKRYESLKKDHPTQYADALEKRLRAAKAWQTAATEISGANSLGQISEFKMPAYDAEAAAELARLELRAIGAEQEWKRSAEKSGSREVAAIGQKLSQNQKAIIQATRENLLSQRALRQLEIERANLDKSMRETYEASTRKPENDKKSSKDSKKKPSQKNKNSERLDKAKDTHVE